MCFMMMIMIVIMMIMIMIMMMMMMTMMIIIIISQKSRKSEKVKKHLCAKVFFNKFQLKLKYQRPLQSPETHIFPTVS